MPLFSATAVLAPRIHSDHASNFAANLNDTQRHEVEAGWEVVIDAAIPAATRLLWRNCGYNVPNRDEVVAGMLSLIEGGIQAAGGGTHPVRPIMYDTSGVWHSCGVRCHSGFGNLAIMEQEVVDIYVVETAEHMEHNGNTPWKGVVRFRLEDTELL